MQSQELEMIENQQKGSLRVYTVCSASWAGWKVLNELYGVW